MKRLLPILLLGLSGLAHAASLPQLQPGPAQADAALTSARLLSRHHYLPLPLNDALSERIFTNYLNTLDRERLFLLQSDVDEFSSARTRLDDAILDRDLATPYAMFNRQMQRVSERFAYANTLLEKGFRFDTHESFLYDREKQPWAKTTAELDEVWRKRVKNDWLRLKLAGKDDDTIRKTLAKRYDSALNRNLRYRTEDVFEMFMNAYARAIEPHTAYLGPRSAEDFAISMKLSLVGIGAMLQERDEYITITELVPGGPAAKSGKFRVGDRILTVAEGHSGEAVDVVGWRIDDVVQRIRGKKGSTVRIEVLPAGVGEDAAARTIEIVRDTITLEEQAASKQVRQIKGADGSERKIGIITLPAFYQDFSARRKGGDFRSATRDVRQLIGELRQDKVDGIILDLRNNTGGSLDEAVRLTGLFIDQGPVVQQRDARDEIQVEVDDQPGVAWDGPFAVFINRASASASEIFAAAIQDYGRGVVVGSRSFGKGTVQTLVDLDRIRDNPETRYGELKLTVAQFFRIDGGTTQLQGVAPDVAFPGLVDEDEVGESSYENALPWTSIPAARYTPYQPFRKKSGASDAPIAINAQQLRSLLPDLQKRHGTRMQENARLAELESNLQALKTMRANKEVSLNEAERRRERDELQMRAKVIDESSDSDDGLLASERSVEDNLKRKEQFEHRKDILLDEAAHVVSDLIDLGKAKSDAARFAAGRS